MRERRWRTFSAPCLDPTFDESPTCRPLVGRHHANRLKRRLQPSDTSLVPRLNAILNDHPVDDFTTRDTTPPTIAVVIAVSPPIKEIGRTHEPMATMTRHPLITPVMTGTAYLCGRFSVPIDRAPIAVRRMRPLIPLPRSFPTGAPQ